MTCNVGMAERLIRIFVGAMLIVLGIWMNSLWGLLGIAPIITGSLSYCPVNSIFGINTCKAEAQR